VVVIMRADPKLLVAVIFLEFHNKNRICHFAQAQDIGSNAALASKSHPLQR